MKKVISLLVLVLFINACDDGNLTQEDISFNAVAVQSCSTNNILYKINSQESLLLQIPFSNFTNEPTTTGIPTSINIDNSTYRVLYRNYNGAVISDNICNIIPPATPTVNEQWTGTSGKIQITTTAVKTTNATTNSTTITGYNHNIVFKNISFAKVNGTQVYESFAFGDFVTSATTLTFGFDKILDQCSSTKDVYDYSSSESFTLSNIDASLIVNTETPSGSPRTALIGSNSNVLSYRLFTGGIITANYFCNTTTPTTPNVNQKWDAVSGVTGVSGIIEVTTIKNGTSAYKHTIVLKNVTLKKGNSTFKLGDTYTYGDLTTLN
jgi:hypothetical protein